MTYNTIPDLEQKSRLRIIRKVEKPRRKGKLVNLQQREKDNKVLMPPTAEQYIKPKDHDFF